MRALDLATLRANGEAFLEEVSREYHQAHAGLKADAQLQSIYERHRQAYGDEAFEFCRDLYQCAKEGSTERRSARMLLDWLIESRAGRALAPLEEREIAWEASGVVRVPDGRAEPYERAAITIANTRETAARLPGSEPPGRSGRRPGRPIGRPTATPSHLPRT